jgi:hypothetical protein
MRFGIADKDRKIGKCRSWLRKSYNDFNVGRIIKLFVYGFVKLQLLVLKIWVWWNGIREEIAKESVLSYTGKEKRMM